MQNGARLHEIQWLKTYNEYSLSLLGEPDFPMLKRVKQHLKHKNSYL